MNKLTKFAILSDVIMAIGCVFDAVLKAKESKSTQSSAEEDND